MLVLSRTVGTKILIGDDIEVTVVAVQGDKVRIGIAAPDEITVDRAEIRARRSHLAPRDAGTTPVASEGQHPAERDGYSESRHLAERDGYVRVLH